MNGEDIIHIEALEVSAKIGVTEEERAQPQRLLLNLTFAPAAGLSGLKDDVRKTVDYAEVARVVHVVAEERSRRLVETLAEDLIQAIFRRFPIKRLAVEIRKFILPRTGYVAIRMERAA